MRDITQIIMSPLFAEGHTSFDVMSFLVFIVVAYIFTFISFIKHTATGGDESHDPYSVKLDQPRTSYHNPLSYNKTYQH